MTRNLPTPGKFRTEADPEADRVQTTTRLHERRKARGLGATEIARRIGISRQTIYAIESGDFVPNTSVALQLARVLEVSVETLFSIADAHDRQDSDLQAELLTNDPRKYSSGELVRIGRVGAHTVAAPVPQFPTFLSDADGTIAKQARSGATVCSVTEFGNNRSTLVVAGCDPALSVLSSELAMAGTDVVSVPSSSQEALTWLKKGLVHVAGTHLRDPATGEYNLPLVTNLFGKKNVRVVTFAEWEQGLVVRRGNPKGIRAVADLGQPGISFMNRAKGSGARDLLDNSLQTAGMPSSSIEGYDRVAPSHLAAALSVASFQADCCIATISAAKSLGLDFLPLSTERFDLIVAASEMESAAVRILFDALNRNKLRRKLAILAGYDTRHTGKTLM